MAKEIKLKKSFGSVTIDRLKLRQAGVDKMTIAHDTPDQSGIPIREPGDWGIYQKYHHTCVYCGFDGRAFDGWMQLSIDHVRPQHQGGGDGPDNLVVACRSCNCITNRMSFGDDESWEVIIKKKRQRIRERREEFYNEWLAEVAPRFLERPLTSVSELRKSPASKDADC